MLLPSQLTNRPSVANETPRLICDSSLTESRRKTSEPNQQSSVLLDTLNKNTFAKKTTIS